MASDTCEQFTASIMTSVAEGLFKSLPKPKYTGEEEEIPQHAQPRGPKVLGPGQLDETQVVLRVSDRFFYLYDATFVALSINANLSL